MGGNASQFKFNSIHNPLSSHSQRFSPQPSLDRPLTKLTPPLVQKERYKAASRSGRNIFDDKRPIDTSLSDRGRQGRGWNLVAGGRHFPRHREQFHVLSADSRTTPGGFKRARCLRQVLGNVAWTRTSSSCKFWVAGREIIIICG